ncbi:MAG: lipopolysaccharide biosynthesis protein [Pseudonocardiaceae bacterium]
MPETNDFRARQSARDPEDGALAGAVGLAVVTDDEQLGVPVSPGPAAGRPSTERLRQLRSHLAEPFSRNAYALLLNTGLTGLLGIVFWLLAARYYTDADVGRGSALISTMTLLSGVVAINLTGTLSRFIPQTGRRTSRLVLYSYGFSSIVVAALTAGFLLTLGYWGPSFDLLRDPVTALWFVAAAVAASVFTVQDGVLVGLRSSVWVPVENALFGFAKIILLVLFATSFPRDGVYLSWVISMALLLLPINGLIFGRLVPRHVRTTGDTFIPPSPANVGRFFAADYVGALFVFGAVYLVPVMVAASVPPFTFAYFYVAWMMAGILNLIAVNLAHSLTVEGVYEANKLALNCRAALRRALGLLLVAAVLVALAAPYCLGVLGRGYLDAGPLLQILAFTALPRALVEIWIGVLRAQNRAREVARVQVASGSLVIGLVLVWLQVDAISLGLGVPQITGVGLAVLASQTVVALAVLPALRRFLAEAPPAELSFGAVSLAPATKPVSHPESAFGVRDPEHLDPGSATPAAPRVFRLVRVPARTWAPIAVVSGLTAAALALYLLPLGSIDLEDMNGFGLISVLPVGSLVGLILLTLAFVITLSFPRPHPVVLGAQLVVLVGCLYGVTALIESLPRFPITWVHWGFVEYIGRTGATAPELDGRFSWPGFFALVAFLTGESNWRDLAPLLKLTPLLSNLLFLLPLGLLLGNLRASWQAKWFAAWLFCVLNWVAQDYFSPQGFTYWLYLIFVAVLVTWFRPAGMGTAATSDSIHHGFLGRWGLRTILVRGEMPARPAEQALRVALLLFLVGLFIVASASHQLTPFLMVAACTGLVLARRCIATGLPILLTVILAAWFSYMTVGYWSGHLDDLFGGVGDLIGNLSTSVGDRASGNDEHQMVVYTRIALTVVLFLLAALGVLRRRLRAIDDRVAVVLLLTPFIAVGLQSYGGEITLRVYLFALPAACVLAAYVFFPETQSGPRSPLRFMAAGACALVIMGGFFLARYGNERYEITRDGDLAAVQYIYQQNGRAQILFMTDPPASGATPFIPVGYQHVERVSQVGMQAPEDPNDVIDVIDRMRELGQGTYLMTTRSQDAYLEVGGGYPPGWGDRFRARLAGTPELRVVKETPSAVVYTLRVSERMEPTQQPVPATGRGIGVTPWTPVGVVFVALLLVVLMGRELWRFRLAPDEHRRLRPLTFAAVPLLAGLALVVVERLVLLAS